ncbi:MAG: ABC transporter ATP-binding protein [Zavarzinella sp.]
MIALNEVSISQGQFSLSRISLVVPQGQYAVLMGGSGNGKTTLLELIAGLRSPTSGTIHLGDRNVTDLAPNERQIGYVPQDLGLFRTMTVQDNLSFSLRLRGRKRNEITHRVAELAEQFNIAHLLKRFPSHLSGGEAQRVALGRALAAAPNWLLLDEPLSSLDESLRASLILLLNTIRNQRTVTVLHVTHQQSEANQLADCLFRLENGVIKEVDLL